MDKENVPPQTISNIIPRLTRTNRVSITNPRGKWSGELLEATMDVVERNIISLWGANKFWGIPITSFFDHLYGKTRSRKIGPLDVLMQKEDEVIVVWVLSMQECGLFITLQQLKGGKSDSNLTHPISKWATKDSWWY